MSDKKKNTANKKVRGDIRKISGRDHVLLRPGMYIGAINVQSIMRFVYSNKKIKWKKVRIVAGLLSAIGEAFTNAHDQALLDNSLNNIWITVNEDTGIIKIKQDGNGIPTKSVEIAFGSLRASSTFDDDKPRVIGGQNGIGIKALNIWSKEMTVITAYKNTKTEIKWVNNMEKIEYKKTSKVSAKEAKKIGVEVKFLPDYERFGMKDGISTYGDTIRMLHKMAIDMAATTPPRVSVYWQDELIPVHTFEDYSKMYIDSDTIYTHTKVNDRWEVGIAFKPDDEFRSVSFVNGISTDMGGEHVEHVTNQIVRYLAKKAKDKSGKKGSTIRPSYIRMRIWVFVKSLIENPEFSSQIKDNLTTNSKDFGSVADIKTSFLDKFAKKTDILNIVSKYADHQASVALSRASDGKKSRKIKGIPKLEDANKAGTRDSSKCTLMLVEGDSAKTMAISGLGVIGRDYYGIFPLKGKLLNTREASTSQLAKNVEITNLKKIIGLKDRVKYDTVEKRSELRYGHILILVDSDVDGSHIKGLLLSMLHHGWPELLDVPGFIDYMKTPIVRAIKGTGASKTEELFYTQSKYDRWFKGLNSSNKKKWRIRYVKGLGGHSAADAKKLFRMIEELRIHFDSQDKKKTNESMLLGFSKSMIEDRKKWLKAYSPDKIVDQVGKTVTVDKFVHNELIIYSVDSVRRSIGSCIDGMVPARRKVVYTALKRNLSEIKVAQFAGAVSEMSSYHHGEASLMNVIIGLVQQFVGCGNNVGLFVPIGQFGSRIMSGKDAASPRYIFTELAKIARKVFHPDDDDLLEYLEDDGQKVEPKYYVPVIPLALSQEMEGIATGFSTYCPPFDPLLLVEQIRRKLDDRSLSKFVPHFAGFRGKVEVNKTEVLFRGNWQRISNKKIEVTELPPKRSTQDFKIFLENSIPDSRADKGKTKFPLKGYENHSTDKIVYFIIEFSSAELLDKMIADIPDFEKRMKLSKSVKLTNMHAFDADERIRKFKSVKEIFDIYFDVRLDLYAKRRKHMLAKLDDKIKYLSAKARFIAEVIDNKLKIMRVPEAEVVVKLESRDYPKQSIVNGTKQEASYDYLLRLPVRSFTKDRIDALNAEIADLEARRTSLYGKTPSDIWKDDLIDFEEEYIKMEQLRNASIDADHAELRKRMGGMKPAWQPGSSSATSTRKKTGAKKTSKQKKK